MSLLSLPPELLIMIAEHLESEADLNALSQTNKSLYPIISDTLYRNNIKKHESSALFWAATEGSPGNRRANASFRSQRQHLRRILCGTAHLRCQMRTFRCGQGFYKFPLAPGACTGNVDIALILLKHGADVEAHDAVLGPPLQAAADGAHTQVVQLLLDWNADVSAYGGYYNTALVGARERE
ncbi:hypothetical protein BDV12DRAFT_200818 [Aspergillus spectabilis]